MRLSNLIAPVLLLFFIAPVPAVAQTEASPSPDPLAENFAEIQSQQSKLQEIDAAISELKGEHAAAEAAADLASRQVIKLAGELDVAELQLNQTSLTIADTDAEVLRLSGLIDKTEIEEAKVRERLGVVLIALYQHEQTSLLDILLSPDQTISSVFSQQRAYQELQDQTLEIIDELRAKQRRLADQQADLQDRQRELEQLKAAQSYQRTIVLQQRQEHQKILTLKQDEQAAFEHKIKEAQQARQEIEQQIFTLKGSNETLQLDDAFTAARYASERTGVRPAVLLAVLKIETNVGATLGSGVFPQDMHPASREAYLRLTSKLGLDPSTTPISRRPASYSGWGGAIGPAQFLPDTWERIEGRVASLMNKPLPDPFTLADALVGVGIMLADRGAANLNQEIEALARYLAGPNWQYHTWYSARVLAVAAEYVAAGLQ